VPSCLTVGVETFSIRNHTKGVPSSARKSAPRVNHKLRFHAPILRLASPWRKLMGRTMLYHSSIDLRIPTEVPQAPADRPRVSPETTSFFRLGGTTNWLLLPVLSGCRHTATV
jgi:hypothetical protein